MAQSSVIAKSKLAAMDVTRPGAFFCATDRPRRCASFATQRANPMESARVIGKPVSSS